MLMDCALFTLAHHGWWMWRQRNWFWKTEAPFNGVISIVICKRKWLFVNWECKTQISTLT